MWELTLFSDILQTSPESFPVIDGMACFSIQPHGGQYCCITWCINRCTVYRTFILFGTSIMSCHVRVYSTFIEKHQMLCSVLQELFSLVFPFLLNTGDVLLTHAAISFYGHTQASGWLFERFHH